MAMFLGEISVLFSLSLFVAGMSLWHFGRQGSPLTLLAAGLLGMLGASLTALCTVYFMVQYRTNGDFESAYPSRTSMGAGMMEPGGMGQRMMERGRMMMPMPEKEEMGAGASPSPEDQKAHQEHHPEGVSQ